MVPAENAAQQDSPSESDEYFPMRNTNLDGDAARSLREPLSWVLGFLLLVTATGILECMKLSSLQDPEIWWHLRIGDWILQHKSWPMTGLFSQASGNVWRDFSWGYDALAALAFRLLGLRALPALLMALRLGLAVVSFLLGGGCRNFWVALGLSAIGQFLLWPLGPEPAYVSLIFFGVELFILLKVRAGGDVRLLHGLPILFLAWANLDPNFVFGLVLLLLYFVAAGIEHGEKIGKGFRINLPPGKGWLRSSGPTVAGCLFASMLNPYGWNALLSYLPDRFSLVNDYLPGYKALGFRQPQDYLLMLLAMVAFFSLGLRRSRDWFQIAALVVCTALTFYSRQELGYLVLVSVAVIGRWRLPVGSLGQSPAYFDWHAKRLGYLTGAAGLLALAFVVRVPRDQNVLLAKVGDRFPVRAVNFLRREPQAQPLFNTYKWGGFLLWYLPEYPVAMDSRPGLYPDDARRAYFRAMNADIPYRDCPSMKQAETLLMEKGNVMGEGLRGVAGFQLIYEDDLSLIYRHAADK